MEPYHLKKNTVIAELKQIREKKEKHNLKKR
jgi:hypothetical protein